MPNAGSVNFTITGNAQSAQLVLQQVQQSMQALNAAGVPVSMSMGQVATAATRTGGSARLAFQSIGQAITLAGGPLGPLQQGINSLNNVMQLASQHGTSMGRVMTGVGGAMTIAGAATIAMAAPMQKAHATLEQAFKNTGQSAHDYQQQVQEAIKHGEHFGRNSADVQQALARLVIGLKGAKDEHGNVMNATQSNRAALKALNDAFDLAAVKHIDLTQAAKELIRVHSGYGRSLKELGVDMVFSHNAEKGLEAAQRNRAHLQEELTRAMERQGEAHGKAGEAAARHATQGTHQAELAERRYADAQQHVLDLQRLAAAGGPGELAHKQALARAEQELAQATERRSALTQQINQRQTQIFTGHAPQSADRGGDGRLAANQAVERAELRLNQIREQSGPNSRAAVQAEIELRNARTRLDRATQDAANAHDRLAESNTRGAAASMAAHHADERVEDIRKRLAEADGKLAEKQKALTDEGNQGARAWAAMHERIKGTAEAQANTFAGHMARVRAEVTNTVAHVGEHAGKLLTVSGPAVMALGTIIDHHPVEKIAKLGKGIGSMATGAAGAFKSVGTGIFAMFEANPMLLLITAAILAIAGIAIVVIKNWEPIKHFFERLWNGIFGFFKQIGGDIYDFFARWGKTIIEILFPGLFIAEQIKKHWHQILDKITEAASDVWEWFKKLPGRLLDAVTGGIKDVWKIGSNIIEGIWHGIGDATSGFVKNIEKWVDDHIPGPIKKILSILSPSKVMMDVGRNVAQGMADGMAAHGHVVASRAEGLARAAIPKLRPFDLARDGNMAMQHEVMLRTGQGSPRAVVHQTIHVEGSLVTERQLKANMREGLLDANRVNGGALLGGNA